MSYSSKANAGWRVAYDQDFTALSLSTVSADGNFTVGTQIYSVQNFARSSIMSVGGTNGLRLKHAASTSTNSPVNRTGPCFSTPSLATLLPSGYDSRIAIRVSAWIKSENLTNNNETFFLYLDTKSNTQRHEYSRYMKTSPTKSEFMRLVLNNTNKSSSDIVNSTDDCFQLEIPSLGGDYTIHRSGVYSSGYPTAWKVRAVNSVAAGTWTSLGIVQLSDMYISMGIESSSSSAGTLDISFGRIRLEYLRLT